ncbi:amidohydrolase family protein [Saccharopolyspora sp. 5N102]|uniref:amidohydrolase family protein n=1 Tax=Saccharopolyspora sp. 5N102 TaxID=3375155 RepID=UPI00378D5B85
MPVAELILTGAELYTVDPSRPWATDLAIAGGRVLAVGGRDEVARHRGPGTTVVDLGGAFVMPGLVDVHNHHSLAGMADLFELSVDTTANLSGVLAAVAERARGLGPDEWVIGGSWGSRLVEELSREAARRALDEAAGGRPVMLSDDSHHNRWANSRALQVAGISATTPDPDGGVIVRDPVTGEPTGLLLETAGIALAHAVRDSAAPTAEQHRLASRRAVEILHSFGVTAFQDAGEPVRRAGDRDRRHHSAGDVVRRTPGAPAALSPLWMLCDGAAGWRRGSQLRAHPDPGDGRGERRRGAHRDRHGHCSGVAERDDRRDHGAHGRPRPRPDLRQPPPPT